MDLDDRQMCISINMDLMLLEIPSIIERLEDLSKNMDEKFGWKEFKFCFKFATSHIVSKLKRLRRLQSFKDFVMVFLKRNFITFKN
jgi:hypothetical protein